MKLTSSQRRAFTLIELLVSSVLTALLMSALVVVLKSVIQTQRDVSRQSRQANVSHILAEQIERDVVNARGIRFSGGQLHLHGFLAQDDTGMPTFLSSTVLYRITNLGLTRTEYSAGRKNSRESLVWAGAYQLHVQLDGVDDELEPDPESIALAGGLPLVPSIVQVTISAGSRPFQLTVFHHRDAM